MRIITSWDDGSELDLKLAILLKKYNIPATFYLIDRCNLSDNDIRDLSKHYTIGGHTVTHPQDLKLLTDDKLRYEITENKGNLENIIQKPVDSFCYPRGRYDERVIQAVEEAGYKDARTTVVGFTKASRGPFRIPTSAHVFPDRREYKNMTWQQYAMRQIDRGGDFFHLWGHSWEIEKFDMWQELEDFLAILQEKVQLKELII